MPDGSLPAQPPSDQAGDGAWYLAQCKAGQEHLAAARLAERGLAQVFLPRERRQRRWRGRVQALLAPLFPGYLFLMPETPDWRPIRTTRGLIRLVSFGGGPAVPVPAEVVAGLSARCDADGILCPPADLRPGERVRILTGAFADLVATIETVTPEARIALLLDLMGRQTRVMVAGPQGLIREK